MKNIFAIGDRYRNLNTFTNRAIDDDGVFKYGTPSTLVSSTKTGVVAAWQREIGRGGVRALRGRDSVILNSSLLSRLLPSTTHPMLPSSCHRASLGSFRDPRNPLMRGSRGCRRRGEGREGGSTPRNTRASRRTESRFAPSCRWKWRYRGSLGGQHRRIHTVCILVSRTNKKRAPGKLRLASVSGLEAGS